MRAFSHFYDTGFPAHFCINPWRIETNAKETEKPLSEFPVRIYSELTDTAFSSVQSLINSWLKGKKREREKRKQMKKNILYGASGHYPSVITLISGTN